jgi:hypothetical protein
MAQRSACAGRPSQLASVLPSASSGLLQHPVRMRCSSAAKAGSPCERGAARLMRFVQRNAAVLDQDHAVGQRHGFLHVVRDQQAR